jgi:hypothetical protein
VRSYVSLGQYGGTRHDHLDQPFDEPQKLSHQLQPVVEPQVLHFMQVPLRTSV